MLISVNTWWTIWLLVHLMLSVALIGALTHQAVSVAMPVRQVAGAGGAWPSWTRFRAVPRRRLRCRGLPSLGPHVHRGLVYLHQVSHLRSHPDRTGRPLENARLLRFQGAYCVDRSWCSCRSTGTSGRTRRIRNTLRHAKVGDRGAGPAGSTSSSAMSSTTPGDWIMSTEPQQHSSNSSSDHPDRQDGRDVVIGDLQQVQDVRGGLRRGRSTVIYCLPPVQPAGLHLSSGDKRVGWWMGSGQKRPRAGDVLVRLERAAARGGGELSASSAHCFRKIWSSGSRSF